MQKFYDKIGVMGSVYGIGWFAELRPGPLPNRAAYQAEVRDRFERAQRAPRSRSTSSSGLVVPF
jgi:hypothetical protein